MEKMTAKRVAGGMPPFLPQLSQSRRQMGRALGATQTTVNRVHRKGVDINKDGWRRERWESRGWGWVGTLPRPGRRKRGRHPKTVFLPLGSAWWRWPRYGKVIYFAPLPLK